TGGGASDCGVAGAWGVGASAAVGGEVFALLEALHRRFGRRAEAPIHLKVWTGVQDFVEHALEPADFRPMIAVPQQGVHDACLLAQRAEPLPAWSAAVSDVRHC